MKRSKKSSNRKPKVKRKCYSKDAIIKAVEEIKKGKSTAFVSKLYGIPESTLRDKKNLPVAPIRSYKMTPFYAFFTYFQMLITRSRIDIF